MSIEHANGEGRVGFDDLQRSARRAASGFLALGVVAGDSVALLMRNDLPFFEATLGANLIGAYTTTLNWHAKADEVAYVLRDSGAKVIVAHADLLKQVRTALPEAIVAIAVAVPSVVAGAYGLSPDEVNVPADVDEWRQWLSRHEPWKGEQQAPIHPLTYTSGTTGRPKGVRRLPMNPAVRAMNGRAVQVFYGIEPAMRTVICGPLYHAAPNAYAMFAARAGAHVVLQPRFDAQELLQLVQAQRISHLYLVPTMFVRLLALPEDVRRRFDLSSLRYVVHAAAPCPPDVKRAMIGWWGPIVHEFYGCSETGNITFCSATDWLRHPGSVGRPLPGAHVRICGDDGSVLPQGSVGEIYMRADYAPDFEYLNLPEERPKIEKDGLFTAGDVGYLDGDGFLFICDRKRDMVISGGVNIYPSEIESVLLGMPGIEDCAVFGAPDAEMGEQLVAVIEPRDSKALTPRDVKEWLRARIAHYKVPRIVEFADELPREDSGKIFKRRLRDPYWAGVGRRV